MKTIWKVSLAFVSVVLLAADAQAGRWLSRDPIQEGAGFVGRDPRPEFSADQLPADDPQLYAFVLNDPTDLIDALGLKPGEVTVTVNRTGDGKHSTLGAFSMAADGFSGVSGYTLELKPGKYDLGEGQGAKLYPIPPGTYKGTADTFRRKFAIRLQDVPGFTGILMHVGNYPWDSTGCILVGSSKQVDYGVSIGSTPVAVWRKRVKLGMITETAADSKGKTDAVWSSGAKLTEMKTLYDGVVAKYGQCAYIVVVVK